MENSNATSRLPSNMQVSGVPMISLDLNLSSLKDFLDNLTNSINQHADLINALQQDIQQRLPESQVPIIINSLQEHISLFDNSQLAKITQVIGSSNKKTNTQNDLDNEINRFSNKVLFHGHGITQNYIKIQELEQQMQQFQEQLDTKADNAKVKERHKKFKQRVVGDIEELKKATEKRDWEIEQKLQEQINTFEEKMQNLEKKTLWKVTDLEEIVKRRITEDYVDDSLRLFEERIKRELLQSISFDSERLEKIQTDLELRLVQLDNNLGEKVKNNKKSLNGIQEQLNKKIVIRDYFEDFRKQNTQQLNELQKRIKDFEKKQDMQNQYDRLNNRVQTQEQRLQDMNLELQRKFEELMLRGGNGGGETDNVGINTNIDPHKLCQLESDLKTNVKQTERHNEDILKLQEELRKSLDAMGLNIYEQGMGSGNQSKGKIQELQEQLEKLMLKIQQIEKEIGDPNAEIDKFRRLQNDIKSLQQKFEGFKDIDRKVNRFFKDFDINSIIKQLRQKADSDDVLKDFAISDTKINTNTDSIGYLRKDVDSLVILVRKIVTQVQQGGGLGQDSSIITTKKLHPINSLNCLSCGHTKQAPKDTKQGTDGKFYKVDTRYSKTQDMNQDLLSSSDYFKTGKNDNSILSSSKLQKANVNVNTNRPSTAQVKEQGNRYMRPGSAKK